MYNSHAGAYHKVEKIPRKYSNEHHIEHQHDLFCLELCRHIVLVCNIVLAVLRRLKCNLALERLEGLGPSSDLVLDLGISSYIFFKTKYTTPEGVRGESPTNTPGPTPKGLWSSSLLSYTRRVYNAPLMPPGLPNIGLRSSSA